MSLRLWVAEKEIATGAPALPTIPERQPMTVDNSFRCNCTDQRKGLYACSVIAIVPFVVPFAVIECKVVCGLTIGSAE
ncbi:hypothetical protein ACFWP3_15350 [Streptomyces sp. NPDC058525]|uniref:hypothetical protein n=1 Tax=Streptomyces sp. NPDC058525 TaxID=3346538 RepID=UPI003668F778